MRLLRKQKALGAIFMSLALTLGLSAFSMNANAGVDRSPYQNYQQAIQSTWAVIGNHIHLGNALNNPAVQKYIRYYTRPGHRWVVNMLMNTAKPYIYYIYRQTVKRHVPARFALLPMIESGYNPLAYSSVGAAGLWQMMPGTASSYGIAINWWYDGRRDVVTSTQSALNYLVALHDSLHSWDLAAAAYNTGEGNVNAAIHRNVVRHLPTDFWALHLPTQTREYVPKLLALAAIIKNPKRYGFALPFVPYQPYFKAIKLTSQIDRVAIANFSGVSFKVISQLNPGMRRFATSPSGIFTLLLPVKNYTRFVKNLDTHVGKIHTSWQYHEIRTGEDLPKVARDYHTNVATLVRVNGLKNPVVHSEQGLLVPIHINQKFTKPIVPVSVLRYLQIKAVKDAQPKDTLSAEKFAATNQELKGVTTSNILSNKVKDIEAKIQTIAHTVKRDILPSSTPKAEKAKIVAKKSTVYPGSPIKRSDNLKTLLGKIYDNK